MIVLRILLTLNLKNLTPKLNRVDTKQMMVDQKVALQKTPLKAKILVKIYYYGSSKNVQIQEPRQHQINRR